MEPELVAARLETLLARIGSSDLSDANEAKTRLLVVDEVLQLLGWSKEDFNPEESTGAGKYTDYLLKHHRTPLVVVEAKRIGRAFKLPAKHTRRDYSTRFLVRNCGDELREAMHQAADYCNQVGAQFAVVTNGVQWIIFRGVAKDQRGWTAFRALVFNGAKALQGDFAELYSLLEKTSVVRGSLHDAFDDQVLPPPAFVNRPRRAVKHLDRLAPRSDLRTVRVLFDNYFGEIVGVDEGEMLRQCYVDDPEIHEYAKDLQALLTDQLLTLQGSVDVEALEPDRLREFVSAPAGEGRGKVALLVGRVGAGKSTFLHRFFGELEAARYARFILDLRPRPPVKPRHDEEERLAQMVLETVSGRYARKGEFGHEFDPYAGSTLRTIFRSVEDRMRRGPKSALYEEDSTLFDRDLAEELERRSRSAANLLPRYMRYLAARTGQPFCLVVDNVDRASDEYQRFVYEFANGLAEQVPGVIVVSMRDTTFWHAREQGFLDTRLTDQVFELRPPNLKSVVARRIKYLRRQIANPVGVRGPLRPYVAQLERYAEWLSIMLLREDDGARRLLTCIASRSVRRAFYLLRQYGESPHAWNGSGEPMAAHLLRALMLGRGHFYSEQDSSIKNVFGVADTYRDSHFAQLRVLAYYDWLHGRGVRFGELPTVGEVVRAFEKWGVPKAICVAAFEKLVAEGLLDSDSRYVSVPEDASAAEPWSVDYRARCRLSPCGHEYLHYLVLSPVYLFYTAGDSCWYSKAAFEGFAQEFETAVALSAEGSGVVADSLVDDRLVTGWRDYLRGERHGEIRTLGGAVREAWQSAVEGRLDQVLGPIVLASAEAVGAEESAAPGLQVPLFQLGGEMSPEARLTNVALSMPELSERLQWRGSKYVPRVLWGLELARLGGVGEVHARGLADLVFEYGRVHIHATNTARFFRAHPEFSALWSVEQRGRSKYYSISRAGREAFRQVFGTEATGTSA